MVRRLKLTSLLFGDNTNTTTRAKSSPSSSSWAWPSYRNSKTDCLGCSKRKNNVYKTENSVHLDSATDSFFTESTDHFSESSDDDSENVIRGLIPSDRLLFEPRGYTSSILGEGAKAATSSSSDDVGDEMLTFRESLVMAMESEDPREDFRLSMEEMVEAHGVRDWECLEELLVWYLRANGKKNHGYIVGAFVDLLIGLAIHESDEVSADVEPSCGSNYFSCVSSEIEEENKSGSC